MKLCFFEDEIASNLNPLTLTRPISDLRIGLFTVQEKWELRLQEKTFYSSESNYLHPTDIGNALYNNDLYVWVNSRVLPTEHLVNELKNSKEGIYYTVQNQIIAVVTNQEGAKELIEKKTPKDTIFIREYQNKSVPANHCTILEHLWDLFSANTAEIIADLTICNYKSIEPSQYPNAVLSTIENIHVGSDVTIEPGAILIADEGPIAIGNHAHIQAGSMIRGNVSIGEHATINMGAKIRGNTSIGPHCKIGGEVSSSIFHSYSNKGHDGFVGHSLIGQWVNLGADTNTSNLKNNYSAVRIADWESKEAIDSQQQFFGSVIGDHSKTAINTMLNTGTICGVSSNIFASEFPPKYIPSFSWVGNDDIQEYRFDKALDAMAAMMKRRNIKPSEEYIQMMKNISENR